MVRAFLLFSIFALSVLFDTANGYAQQTISCSSRHGRYGECAAFSLSSPQLIYQQSSTPCIVNRTWGFNRQTGYLWVTAGCRGVFGDLSGFHYGKSGGFDLNVRQYTDRGVYVSPQSMGMVVYPPIAGLPQRTYIENYTITINRQSKQVEPANAAQLDQTPQFDRDGNPNFDEAGNYTGPHGLETHVEPDDLPHQAKRSLTTSVIEDTSNGNTTTCDPGETACN